MAPESNFLPGPLPPPRGRIRLFYQFAVGMTWLAGCAIGLALYTGSSFWLVYAALLILSVGCGGLIAACAAAWAARRDGRVGQFRIATVLLVVLTAAVFLGAVHWIVQTATKGAGLESRFANVALALFVVLLISTPVIIGLVDSVVWLLVWVLRRR